MYLNSMIIEAAAARYRNKRMHGAAPERNLRAAPWEPEAVLEPGEHGGRREDLDLRVCRCNSGG